MPNDTQDDPSVLIVAPRGRGRPKGSADPRIPVTTWVEPPEFERLRKLAKTSGTSMSGLVSTMLKMRVGRR